MNALRKTLTFECLFARIRAVGLEIYLMKCCSVLKSAQPQVWCALNIHTSANPSMEYIKTFTGLGYTILNGGGTMHPR